MLKEIFTNIYKTNGFNGNESVSGEGSSIERTEPLRIALPLLFKEYHITTILDIPCGDFNWMKTIDLSKISYIGADIVNELIIQNNNKYAQTNINFNTLNIVSDTLPNVDLVLCRDCLVHLSLADVLQVIENIKRSKSTYLLTTTFPLCKINRDIQAGQWRPLNLEIQPFNLAPSLKLIQELCPENGLKDKSLGLWEINSLN